MDYFKILNLEREPFSNSPAPEMFFLSTEHLACLQKMELAVRLRRGLNVVMGDVGMGKTTLCRQLILTLSESEDDASEIETHLLLDPAFSTRREFLAAVATTFGLPEADAAESNWHLKESIKHYLFRKGVDEKKIVVLIIDEGQKLPGFCREILREFLNYETNETKLLQIVIFAQNEFKRILDRHANFADRVNQLYRLKPLNFRETKALIRFRLSRAGRPAEMPALFTFPGLWAVYRTTEGYPRRIITLCHQILLTLIIQNKTRAGWTMVRSTTGRMMPGTIVQKGWITAGVIAGTVLALSLILFVSFRPQDIAKSTPHAAHQANIGDTPASSDTPAAATKSLSVGKSSIAADSTRPAGISVKGKAAITEATPIRSPGEAEANATPPVWLGSLKIHDGSTVLLLLLQIYGNTESKRFKSVVAANPHIEDMNRVRAGETIIFPAIPEKAASLKKANHWVRIARKGNLDDAYQVFKKYPAAGLPHIRMIPMWSNRDGLVFSIILGKGFSTPEEAREAIATLPPEFAAGAEMMMTQERDVVYFAY